MEPATAMRAAKGPVIHNKQTRVAQILAKFFSACKFVFGRLGKMIVRSSNMSRPSTQSKLLRSLAGKFRSSQNGSVAIEFAFVAPVFFLLVFLFIETACMMYVEFTLQAGAQEAARMIRTGQAQKGSWKVGKFKEETCKFVKVITNCENLIKVYVNSSETFGTMTAALPDAATVGSETDADGNVTEKNASFICGAPQKVVAVIVTYDFKFIFPIMNFFENTPASGLRRISAAVMFRNEPFNSTGSCDNT
jgi:Flp pilus assembly protein TadG